jgi:hypothetical protein
MNVTQGVEEFQGLYGPYQVSELVLQKIWLKVAFDSARMKDTSGRQIEVLSPGRWNRLAGPDFKDAALRIDGDRVEGDVEIHFSQSEWRAHGHHEDPNFDRVALHVVYHPIRSGEKPVFTVSGESVPTVSLMELLWYDLEEYSIEDSIIESTGGSVEDAFLALFDLSIEQRRNRLMKGAADRWNVKRDFAKIRIERLGWDEACHMTALEIMGFAANRIPMLHVAGAFPAKRCRLDNLRFEDLWEAGRELWTTSGVRPANHPKIRLEQFFEWISVQPHWQEALLELGNRLPTGQISDETTAQFRKKADFAGIQRAFSDRVVSGRISGSKLDTLICDGFLPLLSARFGVDWSGLWFHWFAGNAPEVLGKTLKGLEILETRRFPNSNGWLQGLLKIRHSMG